MIRIFTCRHGSTDCRMPDCQFERLHWDIYHVKEGIASLTALVGTVLKQLNRIERKENIMSKELDDLTADVADETNVVQSAIVLLNGISARIDAAGADPAKLTALSTDIKASTKALATAVAANTPATPAPSPAPPVPNP